MNAPARSRPGLLQASGLLFGMIMLANACNYVFHALASRSLGPANYGVLVSMVAVMTVMIIPSQAIQTVVARETAVADIAGRSDRIAGLGAAAFLRVSVLGAVLAAGLWASGAYWIRFFHLEGFAPLAAVGFAAFASLVLTVARGLLQGLQRFGVLGANYAWDSLSRLVLGAAVFGLGWGAGWGVAAYGLAALFALGLAAKPLAFVARGTKVPAAELDLGPVYRYGAPVLAAFGAFAALSSLDVIMVKHFFSPHVAGYYGAGSIVGKAFLFLPLAMAQVLFPQASAGHARAENTLVLLHKSVLATAAALAAAVAAAWLLAPWIILTLFGGAFLNPETLTLVRWFGPAVSPLALVYVVMQYNLAVHRPSFVWLLLADIPVLLALLVWYHPNPPGVLLAVGCNHALLLAGGYALTLGGLRARIRESA